ncbi:hypothetical protein BDW62DRAFT_65100 [Aspergillus aurantiobrunneus]
MRSIRFSLGVTRLLALTSIWLGSGSSLPNPSPSIERDTTPKDDNNVITRDIAIIGGGASGTYAAIRLREMGQSVVLIEREAQLGGHTDTYYGAGVPIEHGVWVYSNTSEARSFFEHFNIPVQPQIFSTDPAATQRYDFRTGEFVAPPAGNVTDAVMRYVLQLLQYPYLADGWDMPDPVPKDLLLSFGDFIEKYDLGPAVETLTLYVQGYADVLNYPTVYAMKYFNLNVVQGIQTGFLRPVSQDNQATYRAAEAELGNDVLLSSTIVGMDRSDSDSDSDLHTVFVNTPSGPQRIQATKIIITIPPLLENLEAFDLDPRETTIFRRFQRSSYYSTVMHLPGLPAGVQFINEGTDTPYHITPIPGTYVVTPSAVEDVRVAFIGGGDRALPREEVEQLVVENVLALRSAGFPVSEPEILAFADHYPFGLHVSAEEIVGGFYRELYGLQGYRNTFYSGAAFHEHDSGALWRFTERVLQERVLAA